MADKLKIKVTYVNNANEVINYVNSSTTKNSGLTDERSKDKITNMSFFSHGVASIISLGYEDPGTIFDDPNNINTNNIKQMNPAAFNTSYLESSIDIFSCNSAVPYKFSECSSFMDVKNMTQMTNKCLNKAEVPNLVTTITKQTGMKATGYIGKTDYEPVGRGMLPTAGFTDCEIGGERLPSKKITSSFK
jgi:hypothetical protein